MPADFVGKGVQGELLVCQLGGQPGEGGGGACAAAVLVDRTTVGGVETVAVERATVGWGDDVTAGLAATEPGDGTLTVRREGWAGLKPGLPGVE